MAAVRLAEIVDLVRGECSGNLDLEIHGARTLADATGNDISFLGNPKYESQLETTRAGAVLVSKRHKGDSPKLVRVEDPYVALAQILKCWFSAVPGPPPGVSPHAQVASSARLGRNVAIGPFAVVGENAVIGDNAVIFEGCSIGSGAEIGEGSLLYANVSVYHRSKIGRRCIIHSGAVIGSDGFGFATVGGAHQKIPQVGIVRIEDDVEIGACTTIDRAALGETVIGEGTKIDNLVQIAHNVRVGKHCFLVSMVGIAGSSEIGDHCILAGQAGMVGHIKLGSGVVVAAQSAVTKDWEGPAQIAGSPARPLKEKMRNDASLARLPRVLERMRELERRVAELEKKLGETGE